MEKFTKWSVEHESTVNRRQGAHQKARNDRRSTPVVKKVAEKPEAQVSAPAEESAANEENAEG